MRWDVGDQIVLTRLTDNDAGELNFEVQTPTYFDNEIDVQTLVDLFDEILLDPPLIEKKKPQPQLKLLKGGKP